MASSSVPAFSAARAEDLPRYTDGPVQRANVVYGIHDPHGIDCESMTAKRTWVCKAGKGHPLGREILTHAQSSRNCGKPSSLWAITLSPRGSPLPWYNHRTWIALNRPGSSRRKLRQPAPVTPPPYRPALAKSTKLLFNQGSHRPVCALSFIAMTVCHSGICTSF
jgi:hypothetical protein